MKKHLARFLLLAGLLAVLGIVPTAMARAAEPVSFSNVKLWVYPEYDDPRLLVMLEGKIVGAQPPATVRFLVPQEAEMYSAGSMDAQRQYSGGPPNRKASSIAGWDEISYDVKTDTFRVEYYDNVVPGQPDKQIAYEFRTLYPISDLSVIIQEPRASSNFTVQPNEESTGVSDGLPARFFTRRDVSSGTPLRFDISYTRAEIAPSVKPDSSPAPSDSSGPASAVNPWLITGILIGMVALGLGVYWLLQPMRRRRPALQAAGRAREQGRAKPATRAPAKFCSQCGHRLDRPVRFCPQCGAPTG